MTYMSPSLKEKRNKVCCKSKKTVYSATGYNRQLDLRDSKMENGVSKRERETNTKRPFDRLHGGLVGVPKSFVAMKQGSESCWLYSKLYYKTVNLTLSQTFQCSFSSSSNSYHQLVEAKCLVYSSRRINYSAFLVTRHMYNITLVVQGSIYIYIYIQGKLRPSQQFDMSEIASKFIRKTIYTLWSKCSSALLFPYSFLN